MMLKINGKEYKSAKEISEVGFPLLADFLEEWEGANDFVVAHTSGSTGTPKEMRLLKSDMRASARMTNAFFKIGSGSRLLLCLSPSYIAGKMMIVRAIEAGAELMVEAPSNHVLAGYAGGVFDLVAVVPSQALELMTDKNRLSFIRTMIIGGGEVSANLRRMVVANHVSAYATYGMTETCSHVALAKIEAQVEPFTALPPIWFETDARGCLVVHTPHFSTQQFVTNDIVELLSESQFFWRGRYDNVINTGGIKIFPEEVEKSIAGAVDGRFYVTSRKSEKWGSEVVLVLECDAMDEQGKQRLLKQLASVLPKYSVPKDVVCKKHFRETSSGKMIRESVC